MLIHYTDSHCTTCLKHIDIDTHISPIHLCSLLSLAHTHTHIHMHTHMCKHTHTHKHMHMCKHTHTHTHICTKKHTHMCKHTHMSKHAHTHTHICTHTHTCTYVHTHTHTHICTHTHTHWPQPFSTSSSAPSLQSESPSHLHSLGMHRPELHLKCVVSLHLMLPVNTKPLYWQSTNAQECRSRNVLSTQTVKSTKTSPIQIKHLTISTYDSHKTSQIIYIIMVSK